MADLLNSVLERYLKTYKGLISLEKIDANSVSLSFPFHFASNHRIEVIVTRATGNEFVISDGARIFGELRASGWNVNKELRERLEQLGSSAGIQTIREYLVMHSTKDRLGDDIQIFLEATKTIGDVYFVHKEKSIANREITAKVKEVLDHERVVYQQKYAVNGEIEPHRFDFYVAPNGSRGMAIAILAAQSTHTAAQVWAFKTDDVKRQPVNRGLRVSLIYDTSQKWSDESKRILESRADLVVPDKTIEIIAPHLHDA